MALIIETGAGVAGAEAYADAAAYVTWHTAFYGAAPDATTAEQEGAIRRAVMYLNTLAWNGTKTYGRGQSLAWPRTDVTDCEGIAIGSGEIPAEVIYAQHVLTRAEIASPGVLAPTGSVIGGIKREKVDVIEVEYDTSRGTGTIDDLRTYVTAALDAVKCFAATPGRRVPWAVVV